MKNLAVLVSGQGTILEAMIAAGLPVTVVMADRPCRAFEVAEKAKIPAISINRQTFSYRPKKPWDRYGFTQVIINVLSNRQVDLVAMAGFMTVLGPQIEDKIPFLNTHPSLLPKYKGGSAVADALAAGEKQTGCTIHVATAELDHGRILAQKPVKIKPGDTEATLHERIKVVERKLYPTTIKDILEGRIQL